jgi:hypothetical protein
VFFPYFYISKINGIQSQYSKQSQNITQSVYVTDFTCECQTTCITQVFSKFSVSDLSAQSGHQNLKIQPLDFQD